MKSLFAANGRLNPEAVTPGCRKALEEALQSARLGGWDNLRTPHLFSGLLLQPDSTVALWGEYAGFDPRNLGAQLREIFQPANAAPRPDTFPLHREFCSNGAIKLLQDSLARADSKGRMQIAPSDIAHTVLMDEESVVRASLTNAGLCCFDLATLLETAEQTDTAIRPLA